MSIAISGRLAAAAAFLTLALAGPAQAQWLRAETDHFIIYGDTQERSLRAYAQKVERFDALLRANYPIPVDHEIPKLEIYLADGRRDMLQAEPGISASVAGFYSPNSSRIHAVVNTDSSMGDQVMFHEYGHHFMFQMTSVAYPSWFVEGFAEYYGNSEVRPDRIKFGMISRGRMLVLAQQPVNSWAPMADVLKWRVSDSGRYRGFDYYAQAWGLTHYFMSTPERTAMLRRYLAAVSRGQDSIEAMREVTGRTPEQLQTDMRLYLSGSVKEWTTDMEFPSSPVEITRLSDVESELAWLDLRLDREPAKVEPSEPAENETERARVVREREVLEEAENRATLIREALAAGERRRGDRMAALIEARAYRLSGNPTAGYTTLEPLLNAEEDDGDALRLAAELVLDQIGAGTEVAEANAFKREARAYLARALEADPLDYRVYRTLNESRRGDASYPSDNDISTLEVGVALAPQSFDMRMRLAEAYMAKGLPGPALNMVMPVAHNPHGGSWARKARPLMAAAQAALGQAVEPAGETPSDEETEEATTADE